MISLVQILKEVKLARKQFFDKTSSPTKDSIKSFSPPSRLTNLLAEIGNVSAKKKSKNPGKRNISLDDLNDQFLFHINQSNLGFAEKILQQIEKFKEITIFFGL